MRQLKDTVYVVPLVLWECDTVTEQPCLWHTDVWRPAAFLSSVCISVRNSDETKTTRPAAKAFPHHWPQGCVAWLRSSINVHSTVCQT